MSFQKFSKLLETSLLGKTRMIPIQPLLEILCSCLSWFHCWILGKFTVLKENPSLNLILRYCTNTPTFLRYLGLWHCWHDWNGLLGFLRWWWEGHILFVGIRQDWMFSYKCGLCSLLEKFVIFKFFPSYKPGTITILCLLMIILIFWLWLMEYSP
jgi:hypothetical protein